MGTDATILKNYLGLASDPLKYDSDKDGLSDGKEVSLGLNPSVANGNGIISGLVVKNSMYDSNATVYFHCFGPGESFPPTSWESNWTKRMNNFTLPAKRREITRFGAS